MPTKITDDWKNIKDNEKFKQACKQLISNTPIFKYKALGFRKLRHREAIFRNILTEIKHAIDTREVDKYTKKELYSVYSSALYDRIMQESKNNLVKFTHHIKKETELNQWSGDYDIYHSNQELLQIIEDEREKMIQFTLNVSVAEKLLKSSNKYLDNIPMSPQEILSLCIGIALLVGVIALSCSLPAAGGFLPLLATAIVLEVISTSAGIALHHSHIEEKKLFNREKPRQDAIDELTSDPSTKDWKEHKALASTFEERVIKQAQKRDEKWFGK